MTPSSEEANSHSLAEADRRESRGREVEGGIEIGERPDADKTGRPQRHFHAEEEDEACRQYRNRSHFGPCPALQEGPRDEKIHQAGERDKPQPMDEESQEVENHRQQEIFRHKR